MLKMIALVTIPLNGINCFPITHDIKLGTDKYILSTKLNHVQTIAFIE